MRKLSIPVLGFLLSFAIVFYSPPTYPGGALCGQSPCTDDADCLQANGSSCPSCYTCQGGACLPDDTICEDNSGNECVQAVCLNPPADPNDNPTGCEYIAGATSAGLTDLEDICYYCDPAQIASIDTCGNGVCDDDQEDCSTCPEDCQVPGWDQGTCPVDANTVNPNVCSQIPPPAITFDGPPFNQAFNGNCEDGDVCTLDSCATFGPNGCASQPRGCSIDVSDLCCASGCEGPPVGLTCGEADAQGILPRAQCDIDCCPDVLCGDGLVEAPETCDQLPNGNVGINVTPAQCRDAGTPNECTYCGDGFIDSPTEQCDGTALGNCTTCSGNCVCGIIPPPPVTGLRVFGSGILSCSLQVGAGGISMVQGILAILSLGLSLGSLAILRRRTR